MLNEMVSDKGEKNLINQKQNTFVVVAPITQTIAQRTPITKTSRKKKIYTITKKTNVKAREASANTKKTKVKIREITFLLPI